MSDANTNGYPERKNHREYALNVKARIGIDREKERRSERFCPNHRPIKTCKMIPTPFIIVPMFAIIQPICKVWISSFIPVITAIPTIVSNVPTIMNIMDM